MISKQLNQSFLTKEINIKDFTIFKESYLKICADGYFEEKNDSFLSALLFEMTVSEDFFLKKNNLQSYLWALPDITKEKILSELDCDTINEVSWNLKTSNYFIDQLGLNSRFRFIESKIKKKKSSIQFFNKQELIFKNLKDYQSIIFHKCIEFIEKTPNSRCILQMPTGSGKTRTTMEIVCELMNNTGKDVLWLANTQELCDQAMDSFIEVWHFLRKREGRVVNHQTNKDEIEVLNNIPTFHISTIQSFNKDDITLLLEKMNLDIKNLELVIVDEAHISIAPTYKRSILKIIDNGAKLIGLTATPGREMIDLNSHNDENKALSNFFHNKIFRIDSPRDQTVIEYLREKSIISNARFKSIEGSTLNLELSKKQIQEIDIKKEIPKNIINILTNNSHRTSIIFNQLIKLIDENKKILFFGTSIAHSKMICSLLLAKEVKCAHIDGGSGKYRRKIIDEFKNNKIQVLCNFGILSTGFDDPQIDVVFMARPTNSIVLYSQIIGRGLRGPKIGGTENCEVFTVFDNITNLPTNEKISEYFDEYFIID
jgi:DNA repair protein RadD|tara:strand:+ start:1208 stop:2833 length:1626 start_codon:yes stop_codon:yes gene_type:complete